MNNQTKQIKVQLVDKENLKFILLENANVDDWFSLKENFNVEQQVFEENFRKMGDNYLENIKKEAKFNAIAAFKNDLNSDYQKLIKTNEKKVDEIRILQSQNDNLKKDLQNNKENIINEYKTSKEFLILNEQITSLKKELEAQIDKYKNSAEYLNLTTNLHNLNVENKQLKLERDNIRTQIEKEVLEKNQKHLSEENLKVTEEIRKQTQKEKNEEFKEKEDELKQQIEKMNKDLEFYRTRRRGNSKLVGEELEHWVNNEMLNAFGTDSNISFGKDNDASTGTKADFWWKIFPIDKQENENELISVTIECKTKAEDTTSKYKNEQFVKNLYKNAEKNKSSYALLVTELEEENTFAIYEDLTSKEKKNNKIRLFVLRPEYLIGFLSIFKIIGNNIERINNVANLQEAQIKQDIINAFHNFKDSIIERAIPAINNKIHSVTSNAEKIIKSSEEIIENTKWLEKRLEKSIIKNFEKFNIKKIDKLIKKIDSENLSKELIELNFEDEE